MISKADRIKELTECLEIERQRLIICRIQS